MNRRNVALMIIAAFMLFTTFFVAFRWFLSEPNLTVLLHCRDEISGTLSIATVLQDSEPNIDENFDIQAACEEGKIKFNGYIPVASEI